MVVDDDALAGAHPVAVLEHGGERGMVGRVRRGRSERERSAHRRHVERLGGLERRGHRLAGDRALDRSPFPELELAISAVALAIALLILASQRRADRLADARERMTLELSLQSAQKVSKIIALLEELRRDSPNVPDRPDPEAMEMSSRRAETEVLEQNPDTTKG